MHHLDPVAVLGIEILETTVHRLPDSLGVSVLVVLALDIEVDPRPALAHVLPGRPVAVGDLGILECPGNAALGQPGKAAQVDDVVRAGVEHHLGDIDAMLLVAQGSDLDQVTDPVSHKGTAVEIGAHDLVDLAGLDLVQQDRARLVGRILP